jgi:hypothetical protein
MTTPTPDPAPAEPTAATVVADVHQVLDTAKQQITEAVAEVEHLSLGHLAIDARQLVHDALELAKERVTALFHGAPTQAPPAN